MANGKKTDQQRIAAAERRAQVLDLRKAGAPFRTIGRELGISEAQAHRDYRGALVALAALEQDSAEELRTLEEARLDDYELEATRILRASHPLVSGGKVLSGFTADGKAIGLTDAGPKLAAIEKLIRISESRRKLRGLDAPTKIAPTNADGTPYAAQYLEFRTVLLAALPTEQRLLVAEALEVLNSGQPADS